jgi:hypothetical protein
MNVTAETAVPRRRYQRSSRALWEAEQWNDLSVKEAQSFLASLIYAIDNPWIYADDALADGGKHTPPTIPRSTFPPEGSIVGRPKEWSAYYPDVHWTGILDPEGHVLINDDVWNWHTTDLESLREGKTSLDYPLGVVFRVIRDRFPDPAWKPERSRWSKDQLNSRDGEQGIAAAMPYRLSL